MESTPFTFTSDQKSLLETLSHETGKSVPALIAEALEVLQEHVRHASVNRRTNGSDEEHPVLSPKSHKPIWELFEESSRTIPDEELDRLPTDLAAQVDHYIYDTPKR